MAAYNGEAQAWALGHEIKKGLFLCVLEEKWVPFYSLSVEKKIHGRLVVTA
jgi:hypothetical protein